MYVGGLGGGGINNNYDEISVQYKSELTIHKQL